jgi:hypothetical protein
MSPGIEWHILDETGQQTIATTIEISSLGNLDEL